MLNSVLSLAGVERSLYSQVLFNLVIGMTLNRDHLDFRSLGIDEGDIFMWDSHKAT